MQRGRHHATRAQRHHLVFHQRDKRADDDADARKKERGKLITKALAPSCGRGSVWNGWRVGCCGRRIAFVFFGTWPFLCATLRTPHLSASQPRHPAQIAGGGPHPLAAHETSSGRTRGSLWLRGRPRKQQQHRRRHRCCWLQQQQPSRYGSPSQERPAAQTIWCPARAIFNLRDLFGTDHHSCPVVVQLGPGGPARRRARHCRDGATRRGTPRCYAYAHATAGSAPAALRSSWLLLQR
jgi:hypothetical protein